MRRPPPLLFHVLEKAGCLRFPHSPHHTHSYTQGTSEHTGDSFSPGDPVPGQMPAVGVWWCQGAPPAPTGQKLEGGKQYQRLPVLWPYILKHLPTSASVSLPALPYPGSFLPFLASTLKVLPPWHPYALLLLGEHWALRSSLK